MKKCDLKKGDLISIYNHISAIVLETNQNNQFVDPKIAYYGNKNRIVIQGVNPYYINYIISRCS
jgi:hypothetical protein